MYKKINWNKKLLTTLTTTFAALTLLTTLSVGFLANDNITYKDDDDTPEDDAEEEALKRAQALAIENQFYNEALKSIYGTTNLKWDTPYFGDYDYDDIVSWTIADPTSTSFTDSLLYKSTAYVTIYGETDLVGSPFNVYINDIFKQEKETDVMFSFSKDFGYDGLGGSADDAALIEFLKLDSLTKYETILQNKVNSIEWYDGLGFNTLINVPSIKKKTFQKLYSYSWLWQEEGYNASRYDFNLTQKLVNNPIALVWSINEVGSGWNTQDLIKKENEVKATDYNDANWQTKVDNSDATTAVKEKTLAFWETDDSTSFDGIKVGKSGYGIENVMDIDYTWDQDINGDMGYTKLGNYNARYNDSNNNHGLDIPNGIDNGAGGTDLAAASESKWIINDQEVPNQNFIGVSRADNDLSIAKVQTISPVKVGVTSSWNTTGGYFTSYKYLFNFTVYEDSTGYKYINNQPVNTGDTPVIGGSSNLWEWFNFDTTTDARMEMFVIDQLITADSGIFTSAKKYWYNKDFYIELFGDNKDDYESLIDPGLIKTED